MVSPLYEQKVGFRVYAELLLAGNLIKDVSITINARGSITRGELQAAARAEMLRLAPLIWRYGPAEIYSEPETTQIVEGGYASPTLDLS
jgi:hypothetical protein